MHIGDSFTEFFNFWKLKIFVDAASEKSGGNFLENFYITTWQIHLYMILYRSKQTNGKNKRKEVLPMKTTNKNEVPKSYRRNYKKEFLELCGKIAISFLIALFFVLMFKLA